MEFFQLFPLPVPYLGVTLTIAVVSTALFVGALALSFFATPQANSSLQPTSLDEFGITLTKEGTPVPLLYGINRVPGNIIFYGNLSTKEVFAKAGGGKGSGGSEKQLVGYEYRLDVWQTIGLGKLELVDTYVNDEIKTVDAADIVFDDGTQNTFPDFGQKTRQLEGISHIAFTQFFLGENSQSLPTVHYVVKRILDTGLTNQNMTHGNNPAAVIYDLFQRRGLVVTEFDFTSFENADTYFFNRDIAISMIIDQLTDTKDIVNRIMKVIPIVVYVDNLDRIAVRVLDENDSADWTLVDGDHKDLQIDIQTYSLLDNDFTAKYKDMDQDFSERVVAADNPAVESLAGRRKTRGLDFTIIRKSETASNMVFDQMKKLTFPRKRLTFVSNLKLIDAIPGQVIDFSDTDLAISNLFLRIDKITKPAIGGQDIRVEATEMIEKLFNTEFAILNFSSPSGIGEILPNVVADDIFEFPYTEDEQFTQNIVAIMERTFGVETAFDVAFSPTRDLPVEFQFKQRLTSYSQTGTLDEDYNFTNFIDDSEDGLIYSPNVTFYPEFDPIEFIRSLSQFDRFLLIGKQGHSEIMTFGQIEPEGVASFKIKNIQRGMFGSRVKKTYPAGTTISLFNVLNNFLNFQISNGSILQFQGVFNRCQHSQRT